MNDKLIMGCVIPNHFAEPGEFPPVLETVTLSKQAHQGLLDTIARQRDLLVQAGSTLRTIRDAHWTHWAERDKNAASATLLLLKQALEQL